jgi:transcriptional regulator NrdR family protein
MNCKCGAETKVVDTRPVGGKQKRRRACLECGNRFNTFEVLESELTLHGVDIPEEKPKNVEKTPYVRKEVAEKINENKKKARHLIEDMKWQRDMEEDLFWNGDYQDEHAY